MLLDLGKVRTAREHFERVYPPSAFAGEGETFRVAAPVRLDFDVFKDKRQFRVIGTVKTTLELPCSRCLEAFPVSGDGAFDLRYQPHSPATDARHGEERQIEEDDLSTAYYENDEIDLAQLMREQLYLALPMKPLCRETCQGLCVVCGTNLNHVSCDCKREWVDPRLAVLNTLKNDHHKGH